MFKTRITKMLGVKYPIQAGTMMNLSDADFVAACANAGIFACLASAMYPDEETLNAALSRLQELTDKPFGVNVSLFPGSDARTVEVTLDILHKQKVRIIETAGRSPEPYREKIQAMGAIHIHKCARLRDALKVERLGVDIVSLVGTECGGHPGMEEVGTIVLIPDATDQIRIPLMAGGGFCDGKTLVAGLSLGASGVIMGTRFINTEECKAHDSYKEELIKAATTDTTLIQKSIKSPTRVLKNDWAAKILDMEDRKASLEELLPYISSKAVSEAWRKGTGEAAFPCGQVAGRTKETLPVKALVEKIMAEAKAVSERIGAFTSPK